MVSLHLHRALQGLQEVAVLCPIGETVGTTYSCAAANQCAVVGSCISSLSRSSKTTDKATIFEMSTRGETCLNAMRRTLSYSPSTAQPCAYCMRTRIHIFRGREIFSDVPDALDGQSMLAIGFNLLMT